VVHNYQPEDGGDMFLRNVDTRLKKHSVTTQNTTIGIFFPSGLQIAYCVGVLRFGRRGDGTGESYIKGGFIICSLYQILV
jgi:hypothetical protein